VIDIGPGTTAGTVFLQVSSVWEELISLPVYLCFKTAGAAPLLAAHLSGNTGR